MLPATEPESGRAVLVRGGRRSRSVVLATGYGRWLIPAEEGRASAAALAIHSPVSPSRILAWHAARTAARIGALRLVRGSWGLESGLTAAIEEVVGEPELRIAAWLPRERDKMILCAVDARGRMLAFIKLAFAPITSLRLDRERRAMASVARLDPSFIEPPEIMYWGPLAGYDSLVLRPVPGAIGLTPWRLNDQRIRALASLVTARQQRLGELAIADVGSDPGWRSLSERARNVLAGWESCSLPVTFVHGDFTPWNIRDRRGGIGLVDWEDASPQGPPYWDLWHFVVQCGSVLGRYRERELVDAALGRPGRIRSWLDAYARHVPVPVGLAGPVLIAYLARSPATVAAHGNPRRADRVAGLAFRRRLLERLLSEWS